MAKHQNRLFVNRTARKTKQNHQQSIYSHSMTKNADDYVHETHSSSDERRSSDSEFDDQDSNADDSFFRRTYTCNSDVVFACSDYNAKAGRAYVVKSSDDRRYRVACAKKECEFVVNFAFGREFRPPTEFRRHTCNPTKVDHASYDSRRALKPQFLSRNKVVHQYVVDKAGKPARARFKIFFPHLVFTSATTVARTPAQLWSPSCFSRITYTSPLFFLEISILTFNFSPFWLSLGRGRLSNSFFASPSTHKGQLRTEWSVLLHFRHSKRLLDCSPDNDSFSFSVFHSMKISWLTSALTWQQGHHSSLKSILTDSVTYYKASKLTSTPLVESNQIFFIGLFVSK